MPVYEFVCHSGHKFERFMKAVDYKVPQTCDCGDIAGRIISIPAVFVSKEVRYTSPIDGKVITTRQQRQEDLARSGCVPYDPEMKKDADRRQSEAERKFEAGMDATIEKTIHEMPARKREKLSAELEGGITADYARLGV